MGLDAVELIMGWESAFGIEFSDDEAMAIRTPQMAIDLIVKKVVVIDIDTEACIATRSFNQICQAFQAILTTKPQQIQLDSKLSVLLPRKQRQLAWEKIRSYMGIAKLPPLRFGVGSIFAPITIQDLVNWTIAYYPTHFVTFKERWTKRQIRSVVKAVIIEITGINDFEDNSDFVTDIGIG